MRQYAADQLYPHSKTLSSTQFLDYAKSPAEFYATWVAGLRNEGSPALHFGLGFSELYADRSFDFRAYMTAHGVSKRLIELAASVIKYFPKPNSPEHTLICEFSGWKFRATLDDFYPQAGIIVENKTSALEWTQEIVDENAQLDFQQWVYWKIHGKPCKKAILNWVDTAGQRTKPVTTFKCKRTVERLKEFEERQVRRVIAGIEAKHFG